MAEGDAEAAALVERTLQRLKTELRDWVVPTADESAQMFADHYRDMLIDTLPSGTVVEVEWERKDGAVSLQAKVTLPPRIEQTVVIADA